MIRTLAILATLTAPAIAQDLEAATARTLGLSGCSIQKIDPTGTPASGIDAQVWLDGAPTLIHLSEHGVRAPGFELLEQRADGSILSVDPGPIVTLRGQLEGTPEARVAAGLLTSGLHARISPGVQNLSCMRGAKLDCMRGRRRSDARVTQRA